LKLSRQGRQIEQLLARVAELEAENSEYKRRLALDSHNSGKPPSQDGLAKKPTRQRSLRKNTGRKVGGQDKHPGATLAPVEFPERTVVLLPRECGDCGENVSSAPLAGPDEVRQVLDLPVIMLLATEFRAQVRECKCGALCKGKFPAGVNAPVQYGPMLKAVALYLICRHHVPYKRCAELLSFVLSAPLSVGTLHSWIRQAGEQLRAPGGFEQHILALLREAQVIGCDESGARVAGQLDWLHVACTQLLTLYSRQNGRSAKDIEAVGVLGHGFHGIAVHDGHKPYRGSERSGVEFDCEHALCDVHHLRELIAIVEHDPEQAWAQQMAELLRRALHSVNRAKDASRPGLAASTLRRLRADYRQIIAGGLAQNPAPPPSGKRGRTAQGIPRNLLLRLQQHETDVLRFAHDFRVPFDNNESERAIRALKVHLGVSKCWRTTEGLDDWASIYSYLDTAIKNNQPVLPALAALTSGNHWVPE
jgi:transposase